MIKPAMCFTSDVLERFFPSNERREGFGLRWEKCRNIWFGRGEMTVWTGFNGHGKSLFLNQVMLDAMQQGEKVCVASYEMTPGRTLQRLVRQAVGDQRPDELTISACLEWYGPMLLIHSHMGQISTKEMMALFNREQQEKGINHFVIDSLMKCGLDEEDYNGQKRAADHFQNFAQRSGAHVHLVAHPRKGMDETSIPGKMDVRGTGSITDMADNVMTVWRNKAKYDQIEAYEAGSTLPKGQTISDVQNQYDAMLYCSKCRDEPEAEGKYGFYYQYASMQYHDQQYEAPYLWFDARSVYAQ